MLCGSRSRSATGVLPNRVRGGAAFLATGEFYPSGGSRASRQGGCRVSRVGGVPRKEIEPQYLEPEPRTLSSPCPPIPGVANVSGGPAIGGGTGIGVGRTGIGRPLHRWEGAFRKAVGRDDFGEGSQRTARSLQ